MSICLLSHAEAARLEHWNLWPSCRNHRHVKRAEADQLVLADDARWVGGRDTRVQGPVTMIVPTYLEGRTWRPKAPPLGLKVWQFVPDR